MKYKAGQLNNGKWAVLTGNKHFPSTITENEQEAKERAIIMSMQWYQEQMDSAYDELCKICPTDEYGVEVKLFHNDHFCNKGDLLC